MVFAVPSDGLSKSSDAWKPHALNDKEAFIASLAPLREIILHASNVSRLTIHDYRAVIRTVNVCGSTVLMITS